MRKTIPVLLIFTLLAGCSIIPITKPTMTTSEMATRVAMLLTAMPTTTGEPIVIPSDLPVIPTLPLGEDIGVIATQDASTAGTIAPATDETAIAAMMGVTATPELTFATATPPIAMPSSTPTATVPPPTSTPGGTPQPEAQATSTFAASDPRSWLPIPSWTDPMDSGKNWPLGADAFSAIDFQAGYMILTGLQKDNGWRLTINDLGNAYIEATAKFGPVCQGMDKWGIMLRVPDRTTADQGYWFNITCDGKFAFQKWNANPRDGEEKVINLTDKWKLNSNIKLGSNAVNRLGIMAKGSRFTLYINGAEVGDYTDGSYPSGGFGLLIGARETDRFNIYVDEMSYWLNPPP